MEGKDMKGMAGEMEMEDNRVCRKKEACRPNRKMAREGGEAGANLHGQGLPRPLRLPLAGQKGRDLRGGEVTAGGSAARMLLLAVDPAHRDIMQQC